MEKSEIKQMGDRFYQYVKLDHQKKPRGVYGKSAEEVSARMAKYLEEEGQRKADAKATLLARNEKERQERIEALAAVKTGDIFYYSWGYDQTNVEFWEVTGLRGKLVTLREIGQKEEEGSQGFMSEKVSPIPGSFLREGSITKLIQGNAQSPYFSMTHGILTKYEGHPLYQSHYA